MTNQKITFQYILAMKSFLIFNNRLQNKKSLHLTISLGVSYFLILHLRLASSFYLSQLVDIFGYDLPLIRTWKSYTFFKKFFKEKNLNPFSILYNFHSLGTNARTFLFCKGLRGLKKVKTISELFPNANWLEREISELHGIIFEGKRDTRNLMLQYGDNTAPFQKSFPVMGLKELFYNALLDLFKQVNLYSQV